MRAMTQIQRLVYDVARRMDEHFSWSPVDRPEWWDLSDVLRCGGNPAYWVRLGRRLAAVGDGLWFLDFGRQVEAAIRRDVEAGRLTAAEAGGR